MVARQSNLAGEWIGYYPANPRVIPGKLTVLNSERIVFTSERLGSVEYRRDD